MTSVWPRGTVDVTHRIEHELPLRLAPSELEQSDAVIGAGDPERAIDALGFASRGFGLRGSKVLAFVDGACRSDLDRRPTDEQRTRSGTPEAFAAVGVALHDADLLDRDMKHVDGELRERRRQSLAHPLQRRDDLDLLVAAHGDGDLFLEQVDAGPFEECR